MNCFLGKVFLLIYKKNFIVCFVISTLKNILSCAVSLDFYKASDENYVAHTNKNYILF